jgi:tRNA (adenine37-N6)-methyltransferase
VLSRPGTPILDIKPYVPYCDAFPSARTGWLEELTSPNEVDYLPGKPPPFIK